LHLALSLEDIKNKTVILPSLSFVSTAHAVLYNGGKPHFVDIDEKTLCLDPQEVKSNIKKDTKVILPVHFGGMPAELNSLKKICSEFECNLIEDAAHAAGATYKNKRIGTDGNAVCFSFHPVKNLAMPTGGIIALNGSNSKKRKEVLKIRRWCGITQRKGTSYDISEIGWNMYMNEFSASIGLAQLSKLNILNNKRKQIAKRYSKEIKLENKMSFNSDCSYHLYWIRVKNRSKFMKQMKEFGIETGIHYKPIHTMTLYKKHFQLPITEKVGNEIVSIPIHPNLNHNDVDFIIKSINKIC